MSMNYFHKDIIKLYFLEYRSFDKNSMVIIVCWFAGIKPLEETCHPLDNNVYLVLTNKMVSLNA